MHAHATSRAITYINNYEHKWKIKANEDKFQVINIGTHKTVDIQQNIEHTKAGKLLGVYILTSFKRHITKRKNIANAQLTKRQRFRNLNNENKQKLYTSLVRSKLICPVIPIHITSRPKLLKLQQIQNTAIKFITSTSIWDYIIFNTSIYTLYPLYPSLNFTTCITGDNSQPASWNLVFSPAYLKFLL